MSANPSPKMGAKQIPLLTISRDGQTIRSVPVQGELEVGRGEGCAVRLDDRAISRKHVVLRAVPEGVEVEKKSDFAPLSVNGQECTKAIVKEGDIIELGPYRVRVSMGKEQGRQGSPPPFTPSSDAASGLSDATQILETPSAKGTAPPQRDAETVVVRPADRIAPESIAMQAPDLRNEPMALELEGVEGVEGFERNDAGDKTQKLEMPELQSPHSFGADPHAQLNDPSVMISSEHLQGFTAASLSPGLASGPGMTTPGLASASFGGNARTEPGTSSRTQVVADQDIDAALKLVNGPIGTPADIPLRISEGGEIVLGRGSDCDLLLDDPKLSRRNTAIGRTGGNFVVRDLGSANGTLVNGERVTEKLLTSGDRVLLGDIEFEFIATQAGYAAREKDFLALPPAGDAGAVAPFTGEPLAVEAAGLEGQGAFGDLLGSDPNQPALEVPATATGKRSLLQKFRELPPKRQMIYAAVVLYVIYWVFLDEDAPVVRRRRAVQKGQVIGTSGATGAASRLATFESLTPEQQKFVESQHALAFDYFRNREYDKTLYELSKIFALVPDYKDSREIERYAREGKRKLEAIEQERRRSEEQEKTRRKIRELEMITQDRMNKKEYDQAREYFPQILTLDPDNKLVALWARELEAIEEQRRKKAEQDQLQREINRKAREVYEQALVLRDREKYYEAIDVLETLPSTNTNDRQLLADGRAGIQQILRMIAARRDPLLAEGRSLESSGDLRGAYAKYKAATVVDSKSDEGFKGMERVRGVLHDRAKVFYTEAVIAESYGDYATAKKKFWECQQVAPEEDVYHDRAKRRLSKYIYSVGGSLEGGGTQ